MELDVFLKLVKKEGLTLFTNLKISTRMADIRNHFFAD